MNRSEIYEQIRFLSLVEAHEASDTQLASLVDEGYHVVESRIPWPWAMANVPFRLETTKLVGEYVLPWFSHIVTIKKRNELRQLASVSQQDLVMYSERIYGEPEVFSPRNDRIFMAPIPDKDDYLYDVHYTQPPEWPILTDEPPFQIQFHSILVDWALHRIWEREEDFTRSTEYRSRFEARIVDMQRFYNSTAQDRPRIYGESKTPSRFRAHNRIEIFTNGST